MDVLGKFKIGRIKFECRKMEDDDYGEDVYEVIVNGKTYSNFIGLDEAETIFHAMSYGRNVTRLE